MKKKKNQQNTDRGPTWNGYYSRISKDKTKYSRKEKHKNKERD